MIFLCDLHDIRFGSEFCALLVVDHGILCILPNWNKKLLEVIKISVNEKIENLLNKNAQFYWQNQAIKSELMSVT